MEDIIRASLDHILLAMDDMEKGDVAKAQVHATIASALAPREWDERAVLRWTRDIKAFDRPSVMITNDAGVPSGVAVPGRPTGRERALARRGLQSDST